MQKISEIVCWAAVCFLFLFWILVALARVFGVAIGFFHLFADSPLPWWILALAAIALAAGFGYLLKGAWDRRRIRPHSGSRS